MDIYALLVYKVKRSICITLNKCFLKIMEFPFWGGVNGKGHGEGDEKCPFYRGCPYWMLPNYTYRISPSISREISDNFENANLGVRPILGSRKMSSLTTRQATNMFANESSFVAADKFCEK